MSPCCRSHFAFESVAQGNDGRFAADDFCVWFARRLVRIRQTYLGEVVQVCLRNSSLPIMIAMHCCRRLHFLQQFISTAVPQVAGLNPKVWCVGSPSAFLHALLPIGLFTGCPSSPSPASHHQCPQSAAHGRWRCCRAIPAPLHCGQTGIGQATRSQSVSRAPSIIQILDVKFLIDFPLVVANSSGGHSILKSHSG